MIVWKAMADIYSQDMCIGWNSQSIPVKLLISQVLKLKYTCEDEVRIWIL